jgi:SSS family solute:Na+ symporter
MTNGLILGVYLAALAALGLVARRRSRPGHEEFFLAGRRVGPVSLLLTMAATNFSAFTVFGFAGAGYRIGWAYYPIMAFGTAFMALSFIFIGVPVRAAAQRLGAVTPPELMQARFGNRWLHAAYLAVMVVFTLPYLALQPIGAGLALQALVGIPFAWGAVLVTTVGVAYVLLAGLRGDIWTDTLQGLVMFGAMVVAFVGIALALGGFETANQQVLERLPALFQRPGGGAQFTVGVWFSYMLLWLMCDPMFPQLFQRFIAARDDRSLRLTALLYPPVTATLFFLPVAIGVMGRLVEPGLAGKAADSILPLAVAAKLPGWAAALVTAGGLAALMSTMDSQLLTLTSMVSRDLRSLSGARRFPHERLIVVLLALAGLALALRPVATIQDIATETFTGLAVLFPVTLAAVYWKRANPWAGFASIVAGEALVALYHFKLVPAFGFLPVVPVIAVTTLVLVGGSLLFPAHKLEPFARVTLPGVRWATLFALVFVASIDFWNWGRIGPVWLGLPAWLWYSVGLTALLFLLMAAYNARRRA